MSTLPLIFLGLFGIGIVYGNGQDQNISTTTVENIAAAEKLEQTLLLVSAENSCTCTDTETPIPPKREPTIIPDTDLKTRTFYTLRLKRFPDGTVTWLTNKESDRYNFAIIDDKRSHRPKFEVDKEWYKDKEWEFIPVLHHGNETDWYGLRNRGVTGAYLTWHLNIWIGQHSYHLVMEKNYPGLRDKGDFFLKPVRVEHEGQIYHQIRFWSLPQATVTWGRPTESIYYLAADVTTDVNHREKYNSGGKWFDDTLFSIEEVNEIEEKPVRLVGETIGDLERIF